MLARRLLCIALVALTVLPAACSKRENGLTSEPRNELTIALPQEPVSLNPLLLEGPIAYAVSELLFSYLTNYDANGTMVPDIALEVPTPANRGVSADGRQITFHLRHGVRWQDGAPLTSRDVVFTYRAIMSPSNNLPERFGYEQVASIAAPDPYTVVVRLKRAFAPIVPLFFGGDSNYPILPAHVLERYASINEVPFNEAPVGSGPYKLQTWSRGERLELTANALYYRGKPAIPKLVLPFIHTMSTTVNQLLTGEVNAAFSLDATRISQLRAIPDHRVIVTPIPYFYAIAFNMSDPVTKDGSVRRALALAIDRVTIANKTSHGLYDPHTGMRGLFTWAFDPGADRLAYDPRLAAQLLQRDGWIAQADGTRRKGQKRLQLELIFPAGSDITAKFATAIAAAEAAIGVDVVLKRYTREVYMASDGPVMQGRFQMQLYDYHSNYDPDASWLLACNQRSPGGFNIAHYCNADVDRDLATAAAVFPRTERSRAYAQVQRRIAADVPYFFLCQASEIDVVPGELQHYERPLLSPFNSVARWSLGAGRAEGRVRVTRALPPKKRRA